MKENLKRRYFWTGLLFVLAVVLAVIAVGTFGQPNFFRKKITVETYFVQSINGLEIGAPVKYRGVPVGKVTEILLSSQAYPEKGIPYLEKNQSVVVVRMRVFFNDDYNNRNLDRVIAQGLRAQPQLTGLTGSLYVGLDLLDPEKFPANRIPYDWKPKYPVIPSAPSLATQVETNAKKFLARLDDIHLRENIGQIIPEVSALIANIDRLADGVKDDLLVNTVRNLDALSQTMNNQIERFDEPALKQMLNQIDQTVETLASKVSSSKPEELVNRLNTLATRLNELLKNNNGDTRTMILSLVELTVNLKELTHQLSENPSLLFVRQERKAEE